MMAAPPYTPPYPTAAGKTHRDVPYVPPYPTIATPRPDIISGMKTLTSIILPPKIDATPSGRVHNDGVLSDNQNLGLFEPTAVRKQTSPSQNHQDLKTVREIGSTMSLDSDLVSDGRKGAHRNEKKRTKMGDRRSIESASSDGSTVSLASNIDLDYEIPVRRTKAVRQPMHELSVKHEHSGQSPLSASDNSRLSPSNFNSADSPQNRDVLMKKSPALKSLANSPDVLQFSDDEPQHQKHRENPGGTKQQKDGNYRRKGDGVKTSKSMRLSAVTMRPPVTYIEQVIYELVDTERAYVKDLRDVMQGYMKYICDTTELRVTKEDFKTLFSNIVAIYRFNRKFLWLLRQCEYDPVAISQCFVDQSEGFMIYSEYCNNYPNSLAVLNKFLRDATWAVGLLRQQKLLKHGLPIETYLFKPVQRILKYHLLLKSIVSHHGENEPGHDVIAEAVRLMMLVTEHINELKRRQDDALRRQVLQGQMCGSDPIDLTTFGDLILEDKMCVNGTKDLRHMFLFRKALLICKQQKNGLFQIKVTIMCSNLMLNELVPKDPLSFYLLPYTSSRMQYIVRARNLEQKQMWCKQIKQMVVDILVPEKFRQRGITMPKSKTPLSQVVSLGPTLQQRRRTRRKSAGPISVARASSPMRQDPVASSSDDQDEAQKTSKSRQSRRTSDINDNAGMLHVNLPKPPRTKASAAPPSVEILRQHSRQRRSQSHESVCRSVALALDESMEISGRDDVASTDESLSAEAAAVIGLDDEIISRDKTSPLTRGVSFRKAMEENRIQSYGVRRKAHDVRPLEESVESSDESEATIRQSDDDPAKVERELDDGSSDTVRRKSSRNTDSIHSEERLSTFAGSLIEILRSFEITENVEDYSLRSLQESSATDIEPTGEMSFISDGGLDDENFSGFSSLNTTDANISFSENFPSISPDDLENIGDKLPSLLSLNKSNEVRKTQADFKIAALTPQTGSDQLPSSIPQSDVVPDKDIKLDLNLQRRGESASVPEVRLQIPDLTLQFSQTGGMKNSIYLKSPRKSKYGSGECLLMAPRKGTAEWLTSLKLGRSTVPFIDNLQNGRRSRSAERCNIGRINNSVERDIMERFLSQPSAIYAAEDDHNSQMDMVDGTQKTIRTNEKPSKRTEKKTRRSKSNVEKVDEHKTQEKSDSKKGKNSKSSKEKSKKKVDNCVQLLTEDVKFSNNDRNGKSRGEFSNIKEQLKCSTEQLSYQEGHVEVVLLNKQATGEIKQAKPDREKLFEPKSEGENVSKSSNDQKLNTWGLEDKQRKVRDSISTSDNAISSVQSQPISVTITDNSISECSNRTLRESTGGLSGNETEQRQSCSNKDNIKPHADAKVHAQGRAGSFKLRNTVPQKDAEIKELKFFDEPLSVNISKDAKSKELKFFDEPLSINLSNLSLSSPEDGVNPVIGPFGVPLDDDLDEFDGEAGLSSTVGGSEKPSYVSRLARAYSKRLQRRNATVHRNTRHGIKDDKAEIVEYRSKISPTAFALSKARQVPYDKKNSPKHAIGGDKTQESKMLGGSADVLGSLGGTFFSTQNTNKHEQFSIRETLQKFEHQVQDSQKQHRVELEEARTGKNRPSPPRLLANLREAVASSGFFARRVSLPTESVATTGTEREETSESLVPKRVQEFQIHNSFDE